MNDLIIIRGSLGIGKSTIAKELVKKLKGKSVFINLLLEKSRLNNIEGGMYSTQEFS